MQIILGIFWVLILACVIFVGYTPMFLLMMDFHKWKHEQEKKQNNRN
jgi:hypothetical protein